MHSPLTNNENGIVDQFINCSQHLINNEVENHCMDFANVATLIAPSEISIDIMKFYISNLNNQNENADFHIVPLDFYTSLMSLDLNITDINRCKYNYDNVKNYRKNGKFIFGSHHAYLLPTNNFILIWKLIISHSNKNSH